MVDFEIIENLPQCAVIHCMDCLPCADEVKLAIKQINSGKALGLDGIPVDLLKVWSEKVT